MATAALKCECGQVLCEYPVPLCIDCGKAHTQERTNWHRVPDDALAYQDAHHHRCETCYRTWDAERQARLDAEQEIASSMIKDTRLRGLSELASNPSLRVTIGRKDWTCARCGAEIPKGVQHHVASIRTLGGYPERVHVCETCAAI